MTRWQVFLCAIGWHVWDKPELVVMETFIYSVQRSLFRQTATVRVRTCSICSKTDIERI